MGGESLCWQSYKLGSSILHADQLLKNSPKPLKYVVFRGKIKKKSSCLISSLFKSVKKP